MTGYKDKDRIPYQLDFCRSEAESLGLVGDPEIQTKMTQAAEELDPSGKAQVGDDGKARRLVVSLMVRLNDFRIRRLFQQLYKMRMYALLCFSLLVLSLIMFNLQPVLTANLQHQAFIGPPEAIHSTATVPAEEQRAGTLGGYKVSPETIVHPDDGSPLLVRSASALESTTLKKKIGLFFSTLFHWIADKIAGNPLVFIFFGGLTGGIFSAMMRFQPLNTLPGDELYIFWYRITKPVIGAFGAMVIYIVVVSAMDSGTIISEKLADILLKNPVRATGFAFAFITGFTERFLLPKLI